MNTDSRVTVKIFTISVETPDGVLPRAQVSVPDLPLGLTDLVEPMQRLCDGVVKLAADRAAREGNAPSCGAGCGVCCRQLVPLSVPEAGYLIRRLETGDPSMRKNVRRRFADLKLKLVESGMQRRFDKLEESREDTAVARDYFFLGLPCPFLEDGSCAIHSWRPMICREYNVSSPSSWCADPFSHDIKRIRLARSMPTALAKIAGRLLDIPASLIPMPLMFDWFEKSGSLLERRWNGIGLFDLMMQFALGKEPG